VCVCVVAWVCVCVCVRVWVGGCVYAVGVWVYGLMGVYRILCVCVRARARL